jgi:spore germination protein D
MEVLTLLKKVVQEELQPKTESGGGQKGQDGGDGGNGDSGGGDSGGGGGGSS